MSKPGKSVQRGAQEVLSFGDFRLDLARACVLRGGQEINVRPKAFEALKYLVENPGRVITKAELIGSIWPNSFVTDDSLVQCMVEIRRALADDGQQIIKTVPRRGYIFNAEVTSEGPATDTVLKEEIAGVRPVLEEETETGQVRRSVAESQTERGSGMAWSAWRSNRGIAAVALPLCIGVVAATWLLILGKRPSNVQQTETSPKLRSIAVLPFKPLEADSNDEYLGLGMADTLITRLSTLNQFVVRPTSAVQKYTSPGQDSLAAGREQMVDAVLEGSIQRRGNKVRLTARLLNVQDGSALWAFKCDEYCEDIFGMQDIVSEKVAAALSLKLGGEESKRLAKHYTHNTEAYQLYMKGVFFRNQLTENGLKKSIDCFEKAIELDPNYALAYAGEACSYGPIAYLGYFPVREAESKHKELVRKALDLDDALAEAHTALAEQALFMDWDKDTAEREYRRALELNPNEQLAHIEYPLVLFIEGRVDESIAMSRAAVEIDPLSPRAGKALAEHYFLARQYDEAIKQYDKTRELFPNYPLINPGPSYERKGLYDKAIAEYLDTEARWGMGAESIGILRQAYAGAGWQGYWEKRLDLAKGQGKRRPVQPTFLAWLYAELGDKDKAIEWLQRALEEHDMVLVELGVSPVWDSLRSDPRFVELVRRIGLVR